MAGGGSRGRGKSDQGKEGGAERKTSSLTLVTLFANLVMLLVHTNTGEGF